MHIDQRGGSCYNTACHIAAAKTNFNVLFELVKGGANIFRRNRENKTVYQLVNNNLLMLKIVKKIEKRQYYKEKVQEVY